MTPDEFRNIRFDLGLSQAKMAETLGVCRRSIQYYESGEKPIPKPVKMLLLTLNDYKNLAYILTAVFVKEYYKKLKLNEALDKARQTFPNLPKKGD